MMKPDERGRRRSEQEVLERFIALNPPRRKAPLATVVRLVIRPLSIEAERERSLGQERELIEAEKAIGSQGAGQMYVYHALQERLHAQAKEFARELRRAG
jgi:hypothetical protein